MLGQTIDRYVLVEKLGSGGMGDVYKAHHPSLDQYRAVKILPPHLSQNQELVERFFREARRSAALRHPNIVRLEHVGEQDGLHYMVLDYVEGSSLRALIDDQGPLPVPRAVAIARDVALALDHAHQNGVVHRDVKPSNILVSKEGRAVLTDFGVARHIRDDEPGITLAGVSIGTPEYMSPEQVRSESLDGRSDLYALGVVLYEMVTGELPFQARSKTAVKRLHASRDPEPPSFYNPAVPPALERVIMTALAKDRSARYLTGLAMVAALDQVWEEEEDGQPSGTVAGGAELVEAGRRMGARYHAATLGRTGTAGSRTDSPTEVGERPAPAVPGPGAGGARTFHLPHGGEAGYQRARLAERLAAFRPLLHLDALRPAAAAALERVRRELRERPRLPALVAALATLVVAAVLLQRIGGGAGDRFTSEKGIDPRTGKEYGAVMVHGVPAFLITRPFGELTPPQRAEKTARRLAEIFQRKRRDPHLDPSRIVAITNARGETVLAHRRPDQAGRELPPEDVIATIEAATAEPYANTTRTALAVWWRDLLRDHLRIARGRQPVSTHGTPVGKALDHVFQRVEEKRSGDWVAPDAVERAISELPEAERETLKTAWRTVPKERRTAKLDTWTRVATTNVGAAIGGSTAATPPAGKLAPRRSASASGATRGRSASRAIDGNPATAWESRHGLRYRGMRHAIRVNFAGPQTVREVEILEGRRARPEYQLHVKTAQVFFSDGSTARVARDTPTAPLRADVGSRRTRWMKVVVEDVFENPKPADSHVYLAEVRAWR